MNCKNFSQLEANLQTPAGIFLYFPRTTILFTKSSPRNISENPPSNRAPKFAARSICQMDDSKCFDGLPLQAKVILQRWKSVMPSRNVMKYGTSPHDSWTCFHGKIAQKSGQFPVSHVENYWVNRYQMWLPHFRTCRNWHNKVQYALRIPQLSWWFQLRNHTLSLVCLSGTFWWTCLGMYTFVYAYNWYMYVYILWE